MTLRSSCACTSLERISIFTSTSVCTAKSVGKFMSQKMIKKVQREFLEVCIISSEALSEVELKGIQEEEEMRHKIA